MWCCHLLLTVINWELTLLLYINLKKKTTSPYVSENLTPGKTRRVISNKIGILTIREGNWACSVCRDRLHGVLWRTMFCLTQDSTATGSYLDLPNSSNKAAEFIFFHSVSLHIGELRLFSVNVSFVALIWVALRIYRTISFRHNSFFVKCW